MEAVRAQVASATYCAGVQTRSVAVAKFWKERGMLFLGCSNDGGMLYERATEVVSQIGAA